MNHESYHYYQHILIQIWYLCMEFMHGFGTIVFRGLLGIIRDTLLISNIIGVLNNSTKGHKSLTFSSSIIKIFFLWLRLWYPMFSWLDIRKKLYLSKLVWKLEWECDRKKRKWKIPDWKKGKKSRWRSGQYEEWSPRVAANNHLITPPTKVEISLKFLKKSTKIIEHLF